MYKRQVGLAVPPDETVDADALVSTLGVLTGAVVLAGVGGGALVHVQRAVLAGPLFRAAAGVGVHAIHALPAVLTQVAVAVVDVDLAVVPRESWSIKMIRMTTINL